MSRSEVVTAPSSFRSAGQTDAHWTLTASGVFSASPFGAFERFAAQVNVPAERVLEIVFGPYDLALDNEGKMLVTDD